MKVVARIVCILVHAFLAMAAKEVLEIAGSGATNPSDCVNIIMDRLQIQAKLPTRMTYRAIGTGSGQDEFISADKVVHFAFSDVPLSQEKYDEISLREETLQLPFILGAVSFFHNVPDTPYLNLTSCIIAKMYRGEITSWDDAAIAAENPALVLPPGGLAVRVIRRADSSGGTSAMTGYLATACPDVWPAEEQGSEIEWSDVTVGCEGSSGVVQCVQDGEGTIGYLAASHGHDARLLEVILTNKDGTRLTSEEAYLLGGIAAAATENSLPDSPDQFYPVQQFMDQPGVFTWPLVQLAHVFVRRNLTYIEDPREQSLVKLFLQSLYQEEYVLPCETEYEFTRVSGPALELAQKGLASLILSPDAPEWTYETDLQKFVGAGDYVVSAKRTSSAEVERALLDKEVNELKQQVLLLIEALDKNSLELSALSFKVALQENAAKSGASSLFASWEMVLTMVTGMSLLPFFFY